MFRASLLAFATLLIIGAFTASAALAPVNLRVEWLRDPLGVEAEKPRLSWRVEESDEAVRGQKQTKYRVLVAASAETLAKDSGDVWDSGEVASDETLNIEFAGKPLASGSAYFWKVRVWDKDDAQSVSATARWTMGLLKADDWKAQWISYKDESALHKDRAKLFLPPAHYYRKTFTAAKEVRRAMLFGTALGLVDFHFNGERAGDDYFAPGWSDYRQRAYYRAYDVTKLVRKGENVAGAAVADGWYAGYVGYGMLVGYGPDHTGRNIYGKTPALLAQLNIEYADGTHETVGTDATWETSADGPIREADLLMGESYDARLRQPWTSSKVNAAADATPAWSWVPAIRAEDNGSVKARFFEPGVDDVREFGFQKPAKLVAYTAPPIRVTQELPAKTVTKRDEGTYIFDFGQNFAGNVRLRITGAAGQKLTLRYGEMLHADGRLMMENLRKARATDTYICRGGSEETWTPRFTYHGFQYCELSGLTREATLEMLTGLVLHNDTPLTSSFACSDEALTKFWQNTVWTQRANFIEVPTDCPQRDERLGWMGDAQIYARTATYNADVAAFFTKWVDDVREAQRPNGAYPDYAPYPFAHGAPGATHGTAWTDAGVLVPYTMWKVYGDTRLIERHWDSMVKFMDWRAKADPGLKGVKLGNTWGDWLNVNEDTPIEYVDLCYHRLSASLMALMADALGKRSEADRYAATAERLRVNFRERYAKPDGSLRVETQSATVLALETRMFEEAESLGAAARLAERIAKNDTRMATGFLGTKPLLLALTANGQLDLACRLFQSRKFPSWGYEVEQGATSVWERWDSFTKEHGFDGATGKNNAAMNSFSHYAFGAVMQWGFQTLAGIDTDGPGFRHIIIQPHVPSVQSNPDGKPLDWVRASYDHPRGRILSEWKRHRGKLMFKIIIPANRTASAFLPAKSKNAITEEGAALSDDYKPQVEGNGREMKLTLSSGTYHFEVTEAPATPAPAK